jgi:hypothetical protein
MGELRTCLTRCKEASRLDICFLANAAVNGVRQIGLGDNRHEI